MNIALCMTPLEHSDVEWVARSRARLMLGIMICAICHYLATDGQEVREAVTVVAGYAACEPHFAIAEVVGKVDDGIGLSALDRDAAGNCGQCGRMLGSDLGAFAEGPDDGPLCITCALN
jgi:hypothetical protein